MSPLAFRVVASSEVIASMQQLAQRQQVALSQPQPFDSTSEPLNAPISGGEIMQAAQMITMIFAAGSAALTFFGELIDLVRKTKQPLELRRPADNRSIVIRPDTDLASVREQFPDV